jgi:hypothetical protein
MQAHHSKHDKLLFKTDNNQLKECNSEKEQFVNNFVLIYNKVRKFTSTMRLIHKCHKTNDGIMHRENVLMIEQF